MGYLNLGKVFEASRFKISFKISSLSTQLKECFTAQKNEGFHQGFLQ